MSECSFSTNAITLDEIGVVEEIAKNLGLYVSLRRQQASYILVLASIPSSSTGPWLSGFFQFFAA